MYGWLGRVSITTSAGTFGKVSLHVICPITAGSVVRMFVFFTYAVFNGISIVIVFDDKVKVVLDFRCSFTPSPTPSSAAWINGIGRRFYSWGWGRGTCIVVQIKLYWDS